MIFMFYAKILLLCHYCEGVILIYKTSPYYVRDKNRLSQKGQFSCMFTVAAAFQAA